MDLHAVAGRTHVDLRLSVSHGHMGAVLRPWRLGAQAVGFQELNLSV